MNSILDAQNNSSATWEQSEALSICRKQMRAMNLLDTVAAQSLNFIWADPQLAQVRFNAFIAIGVKVADLVLNAQAYAAMQKVLNGGIEPPSPVPAGWSFVVNETDNSVVVTGPT